MLERDSDIEWTFTALELAVSFQPIKGAIVDCLRDVETHIEPAVISTCKGKTDFSLALVHLRYSDGGVRLLQSQGVQKDLFVSHEVRTLNGLMSKQIG